MRFALIIAILSTTLNCAYGSDSLRVALTHYQFGHFEMALPMLSELANKFKKRQEYENYALCQIKLADIIRLYGAPNLALEMLKKNQYFIEVAIDGSSLLLAENHLAKAEAQFSSIRITEFRNEILNSIRIKSKANIPETYFAEDYMHLGRYYKEMPNGNDSSLYYIQLALKLAKADTELNDHLISRIYNLMGYYYHPASIAYFKNRIDSFHNRLKTSRLYYDSALIAINNQPTRDLFSLSRVYHNLGNSYNNQYQADGLEDTMNKALIFYKKGMDIMEKLGSPVDMAMRNWVVARGYERMGDYDLAIDQINIGVNRLMPEYAIDSKKEVPPFLRTLNDHRFISLISIKAGILNTIALLSKQEGDLFNTYNHWIYLMSYHKYLVAQAENESEAIHWSYLYGSNTYQNLAQIVYFLQEETDDESYLKNAFGLLSSGKYAYLNRNEIKPETNHQLLSSTLVKERKIIIEKMLRSGNIQLHQPLSFLPDIPSEASESIMEISSVWSITDTLSMKVLQQEILDINTAFLDFYISNISIFCVIVQHNKIELIKLNETKNLHQSVRNLKKQMIGLSPRDYTFLSHRIYEQTLHEVVPRLPNTIKKLIICPDGYLQEIPWDALVTDTLQINSFKELNYFSKRYTIKSVLSPIHLIRKGELHELDYVGVAADFNNSSKLSTIPFSTALIKEMVKKKKGILLEELPDKELKTRVLHIATHIQNDTLQPFNSKLWIQSNDSISIATLASSRLKPQLVVLNGCSSGLGKAIYTEGAMSFARTFYRLGAETVLMTLWNVDDKTTADLLRYFYIEIDKGLKLDIALQNAKQNYLDNITTDELANPYYWAGLQLTGKSSAINEKQFNIIYFAMLSIITMLMALFVINKIKKRIS
ncbi:MAG TPA: CHAT domain-containing protein [Cyclobacteriaceae bacterium]|nr:CHAT domain-containing protein [Cyclobacteriaceae bacterium]